MKRLLREDRKDQIIFEMGMRWHYPYRSHYTAVELARKVGVAYSTKFINMLHELEGEGRVRHVSVQMLSGVTDHCKLWCLPENYEEQLTLW